MPYFQGMPGMQNPWLQRLQFILQRHPQLAALSRRFSGMPGFNLPEQARVPWMQPSLFDQPGMNSNDGGMFASAATTPFGGAAPDLTSWNNLLGTVPNSQWLGVASGGGGNGLLGLEPNYGIGPGTLGPDPTHIWNQALIPQAPPQAAQTPLVSRPTAATLNANGGQPPAGYGQPSGHPSTNDQMRMRQRLGFEDSSGFGF